MLKNKLRGLFILFVSVLAVACDGGSLMNGGTTTPPPGDGTLPPKVAAVIHLFGASDTLRNDANDPSKGLALTAVAIDSAGNTVSGVEVAFSVNTGSEIITVTQGTTDASGIARAVLWTVAATPVPRTATITASSGTASDSVTVTVIDATQAPSTTAPVSAVKLFANASQLFADADEPSEGVLLTAVALNSAGNVVPGVPVTFVITTMTSGGAAALEVIRGTTDNTGTATARLWTGGDPTPRTITVQSSVTSGATTLSDSVSLPVVGHAKTVLGTISGLRLPAANAGSVTVRARALDADNNPVANVPVTFFLSAGSFSSTVADTSETVTTAANGETTSLQVYAGSVPAGSTITVTMTAPGATADSIDVLVVPPVNAVELLANSSSMLANADEVAEGVTLTALVKDANGGLLPNEGVSFAIVSGSGGLTPSSAVTNASGAASTVLTNGGNYSFPRSITVRATSVTDPTRFSDMVISVVDPATPPAPVAIAAVDAYGSSAYLHADADTAAEGVTITAVVTNANGNVVKDVPVDFALSLVSGTGPAGSLQVTRGTTDATGAATAVVTTSGNTAARVIRITVTATGTAADGSSITYTDAVDLEVIGRASKILGTLSALQLPNDDSVPVTVKARAVDASNNLVANVPVTFFLSSGSFSPTTTDTSETVYTGSNGETGNLTIYTGGDPSLRTITVTMTAPGATAASAEVQVIPAVATVNVFPGTASLHSGADTSAAGLEIRALARDSNGVALAGVPIQFALEPTASGRNGVLQVINGTTDAAGTAYALLTVGNAIAADVITVKATYDRASGTDPVGTATVTVVGMVSSIQVTSSSPQLPTNADQTSEGVTITAIVRDSNNNLVTGVPVAFSTNGGAVQVTRGTTDETGTATAILTTGGDPTNRTITVTATAETLSSSVDVAALGTRVSIAGVDAVGSLQTVSYTVSLVDSGGAPLAQRQVTLAALNGLGTLNTNSVTTDSFGKASFTVTGTTGGAEVLQATALGAMGTKNITISEYDLEFITPASSPVDVNFGVIQELRVRLRQNGAALAGATVRFSATRGTVSSSVATTDGTGEAAITIRSSGPGGAGLSLITATGPESEPINRRVSTSTEIEFVATTPASIDVQASPQIVSASTATTTGQSTIRAIVRDANGNLVKNKQVDFQLFSNVGGGLSPATGVTDSLGTVEVTFTAGTQPSGDGAVIVRATQPESGIFDDVALTIGGVALRIVLGTGNELLESPDTTSYRMPFSVIVTDSAGNPAPADTVFRLKLLSMEYQKGYYTGCDTSGDNKADIWCPAWTVTPRAGALFGCLSEDVNGNGILDLAEDVDRDGILDPTEDLDGDGNFDIGEDLNRNGKLDLGEDRDGDGVLDRSEDLDRDGRMDVNEDLDADGYFDLLIDDTNGNGSCDPGEPDRNGDGNCDLLIEDLDGDRNFDVNEDLDLDGRFDDRNEDLDRDLNFDNVNEDANGNLVLDVGEDLDSDGRLDIGEDRNRNGTMDQSVDVDENLNGRLEPGNVGAVPTTVPLNADGEGSGRGSFNLVYPKSYGNWVMVRLEGVASVAGTETVEDVTFVLPVLADDLKLETSPPGTVGPSGYVESPYGIKAHCSNPN